MAGDEEDTAVPKWGSRETGSKTAIRVYAKDLACGVDLLEDRADDQPVELTVARSTSQGHRYSLLRLVTYREGGWWEYNGVAVQVAAAVGPRRIVIHWSDLRASVHAAAAAATDGIIRIEWRPDLVQLGHETVHASGQHVPPLPEPRDHPERVHLPTSEPRVGRLALETERGTFELSAALVAHLVRRGAGSGTVAMTHGATYLSAAASIRAHASLVPMTVAPLAYVPPERPAAPAGPTGKAGAGSRFGAIPEPPAAPVESAEPARIDPAPVPPPPEPAPPPPEPAPPRLAPAPEAPDPTPARHEPAPAPPETPAPPAPSPAAVTPSRPVPASPGTPALRAVVAANPGAPPDVLERLAGDSNPDVALAVAQNPAATPAALVALAAHPDPAVAAAVMAHPRCDDAVLSHLVENPAIGAQVLDRLATHPDPAVRADIAANPASPSEVLVRLARDADAVVLSAVASNPACPPEVLRTLIAAPA